MNCYPVQVVVNDSGGAPARHRAQVQKAVAVRKAIAFLANAEALTGKGFVTYLEVKRVSVIGMYGGEDLRQPDVLSPGLHRHAAVPSTPISIAAMTVFKGRMKLGTLVCVEAQACASADNVFSEEAKAAGFEHVDQGKAPFAQPDFTAECLTARNAGAETLFVALDENSIGRVVDACRRQGYQPTLAIPFQTAIDGLKEDPASPASSPPATSSHGSSPARRSRTSPSRS